MNGHCWRCRAVVNSQANILCPECHRKESAKVHAHDDEPTGGLSCTHEDSRGSSHLLPTRDMYLLGQNVDGQSIARNGQVVHSGRNHGSG